METLFYIALATSVPLLFYFFVALVNHKVKQMDQELERRTEGASLTTAELEALVHAVVSERLAVLLERTERNEERIAGVEQLLTQPEPLQLRGDERHPELPEQEVVSDELTLDDVHPDRERTRSG